MTAKKNYLFHFSGRRIFNATPHDASFSFPKKFQRIVAFNLFWDKLNTDYAKREIDSTVLFQLNADSAGFGSISIHKTSEQEAYLNYSLLVEIQEDYL